MAKGEGMHGEGVHGEGGVHGKQGACVMRGCTWQGGMCGRGCACWGACMAGGVRGRGACMQERQPLKRVVRIILECILVYSSI